MLLEKSHLALVLLIPYSLKWLFRYILCMLSGKPSLVVADYPAQFICITPEKNEKHDNQNMYLIFFVF